jgi:iron complex transport system substrate-binding protein
MRSVLTLIAALAMMTTAAQAREVIDMIGRKVTLPDRVERVACLEVLCYPKLFMLGADDRIVAMGLTAAPWAAATNPRYDTLPILHGEGNVEELIARKADVAFLRDASGQQLAKLTSLGIPAIVAQPNHPPANSPQAFIDDAKAMVRLTGQVLGGEAETRAEDWCAYFDQRVRFVTERVARIPADRRIRVYYVRGPEALSTQGKDGYTTWAGQLAGANMVVTDTPFAGKGFVSMEDIVRWNPEVVLVGRQYPLEVVQKDPRWKNIAAVKSGRVQATPEGVFYWDGGPEQVLLIQFIAKLLYPDLFQDLDMASEVKGYYARFYRAALSDDDVAKLLEGRSPDGSRRNPMNN